MNPFFFVHFPLQRGRKTGVKKKEKEERQGQKSLEDSETLKRPSARLSLFIIRWVIIFNVLLLLFLSIGRTLRPGKGIYVWPHCPRARVWLWLGGGWWWVVTGGACVCEIYTRMG